MIRNILKNSFLRFIRAISNDELYYRIRYFIKFKSILDLSNPVTFNAKINYLKLNDRNPFYTKLVDKYEVRKYVENKIGNKYLNEVLGIYKNVKELDFKTLPNSFVLKATHGSSWVIVCDDKMKLNKELAKREMSYWLNNNFYKMWGEWVYKNVEPRVICEQFLENKNEVSLLDYKFYCFHGEPKFIHVDIDRAEKHERNFYDLNWERLPFGLFYPQSKRDVNKPKQLELMIELAKKLSADFVFVRVDFYEVENKVIFGELTFYPGNGLEIFTPRKYDNEIGKFLNLDC